MPPPPPFVGQLDLAEVFAGRPLAHWRQRLEGTDACFAPVLSVDDAADHPHNRERGLFIDVGGVRQPAPAPRFEGTPLAAPSPPRSVGEDTNAILAELGLGEEEIGALRRQKVIA